MKIKIIISLLILVVSILLFISPKTRVGEHKEKQIFKRQRKDMVRAQIRARGIEDKRLLEAMQKVKRHLFVSTPYRLFAYTDNPLPIGKGQTISQPYIVALMTELLELKGNEKILEIGTGSGYQAAVLAELAEKVYTIEIIEPLARNSEKLLRDLGYKNIQVKYGDGYFGWPKYAPFDAIIVTCAPEDIPTPLIEQLVEGGRLVIPVGEKWQELKLVKKIKGKIITENIIPVRFVPMLRNEVIIEKIEEEDKQMTDNLKKHVKILSEDIGERNFIQYQNLELSADYIKQEFEKYGYNPQDQIYYLKGKSFRNIIATNKGRLQPEKTIIIGAHYDSVLGSPGADDNASGVAGLLELSRLLSENIFDKTIKFIAFTNEEPPFFMSKNMGSYRYAEEARKNGEDILGMLCLESIGYYSDKDKSQSYPLGFSFFYPDKGNFIVVVSNFNSRYLLKRIVKEFKEYSDFPIESHVGFSILAPAISFSDQWSFWKYGYKAVMITDTAFYRTPYYHTSEDTLDKINYQSLSYVIKGLYQTILELEN